MVFVPLGGALFEKREKWGTPVFSLPPKGNPRETYSPEIGPPAIGTKAI
jgi:hypothetical protein